MIQKHSTPAMYEPFEKSVPTIIDLIFLHILLSVTITLLHPFYYHAGQKKYLCDIFFVILHTQRLF